MIFKNDTGILEEASKYSHRGTLSNSESNITNTSTYLQSPSSSYIYPPSSRSVISSQSQSSSPSQSQSSTLSEYTKTISFLNTYLLKKRYKSSSDSDNFLFRKFLRHITNYSMRNLFYFTDCVDYINEYTLISNVKKIDDTITYCVNTNINSVPNNLIHNLIQYIPQYNVTTDESNFIINYNTQLSIIKNKVIEILQTNQINKMRLIQECENKQRDDERQIDIDVKNLSNNEKIRYKNLPIQQNILTQIVNLKLQIQDINKQILNHTSTIQNSFNLFKFPIIDTIYNTLSNKINNIINRICIYLMYKNNTIKESNNNINEIINNIIQNTKKKIKDTQILSVIDTNLLTTIIYDYKKKYYTELLNKAKDLYFDRFNSFSASYNTPEHTPYYNIDVGCVRNSIYNKYTAKLTDLLENINNKNDRVTGINISSETTYRILHIMKESVDEIQKQITQIQNDLYYLNDNIFTSTYSDFTILLEMCNTKLHDIPDLTYFKDYIYEAINTLSSDHDINTYDFTFESTPNNTNYEKKVLCFIICLKYNININIEAINNYLNIVLCNYIIYKYYNTQQIDDACKILVVKYIMNNIMSKLITYLQTQCTAKLISINKSTIDEITNHRNGYKIYEYYIYNDSKDKPPPTVNVLTHIPEN